MGMRTTQQRGVEAMNPLNLCNACDAAAAVTDAGYCAECDPEGAAIVADYPEPTLNDAVEALTETLARLNKYVTG